jgi:hypothetical protein
MSEKLRLMSKNLSFLSPSFIFVVPQMSDGEFVTGMGMYAFVNTVLMCLKCQDVGQS